jgi:hypothetical protein
MNLRHVQARPPVRVSVRLSKALTGAVVIAAALCWNPAGATDYTVTTRTTGTTGSFFLGSLFPQGELNGNFGYELTVTSAFSSDNVTATVDRRSMTADHARLDVALKVNNRLYSLQTIGMVSSLLRLDTDGDGRTIKRFYNTISFDPASTGDFATIEQYLFLDADQFAIDSVLQPATGYYADPITKGFSMYDWTVNRDGSLDLLGDAAGRANTFEYNLVAVPEPGTWAMLSAGLAIVGFSGRRRRQAAAVA